MGYQNVYTTTSTGTLLLAGRCNYCGKAHLLKFTVSETAQSRESLHLIHNADKQSAAADRSAERADAQLSERMRTVIRGSRTGMYDDLGLRFRCSCGKRPLWGARPGRLQALYLSTAPLIGIVVIGISFSLGGWWFIPGLAMACVYEIVPHRLIRKHAEKWEEDVRDLPRKYQPIVDVSIENMLNDPEVGERAASVIEEALAFEKQKQN